MSVGRRMRVWAVVSVGSALGGVALWLHRLGDGDLGVPPVRSWSATSSWYETVGPDVAAMAVVRLIALGLILWLLTAILLQAVSGAFGLRLLRSLADLISPRSLQRLGQGLVGLSLTAGLAAPAPGAGIPAPSSGTATMHLVVPGEVLNAAPSTTTTVPSTTTSVAPSSSPVAPPVPAPAETVVVEAGDSLWSISAEEVGGSDDQAITTYWRRLVEANRSHLVDPANPDLIFPGQTLILP